MKKFLVALLVFLAALVAGIIIDLKTIPEPK